MYEEGEHGTDMYFVANGEVAVVTGPRGRHTEVTRLREGAFFGEMALLSSDGARRTATILSSTLLMCEELSRRSIEKVGSDFPELLMHLSEIAVRALSLEVALSSS